METVPEELRCKRSDGKQWRCSAPSMPDKTVCEKHYVQAKKRSASSALRASLRRSSAASASYAAARCGGGDYDAVPPLPMAVARPLYGRVAGEPVYVAEPAPPRRPVYGLPLGNAAGAPTAVELVGRGLAGLVAMATCHQCRRGVNAIWCTSCERRGYCTDCISRWYSDIPMDDVRKVCPACRGICNCKVCLQGDNVIKARVQEISVVDKLRYLHSILAYVLPVLKQIYSDQCFEIGVDTKAYGLRTDILRAKISSDEQMCCDFCKVAVFDYHRHCPKCLYDLCLDCCRDIRRSRTNVARGEYTEDRVVDRNKGEPIVIRNAFEPSLSSSWDPLNIWRGIQEIMDEKVDEDVIVKAVDFSNQTEVDVELKQFIKGYSDGHRGEDGQLIMLKLKEWPQPSVLEEFLLCQRPEFIVNFPLVDFIHSRWGLLNLSAKLPLDTLQPEVGLKLLIAYGRHQEAGKGDSVTNLMINMGDVVHMLMHTTEVHNECPMKVQPERSERIANGMTVHVNAYAPVQNLNVVMGEQSPADHIVSKSYERVHTTVLRLQDKSLDAKLYNGSKGSSVELSCSSLSEEPKVNGSESSKSGHSGAVWDVFSRQDLPKLNEYLAANWEELTASTQAALSVISSQFSMPDFVDISL
ncbi:hypothetical protein GUJ93_ZPchr0003g17393 [Zizania palustris]|uniref:WRC domain-containing protein n=1 Tax=Zizania palustris TaxID=103762 RepID=A0A8J5S9D2_ZIZPA|nr:hypothetical protein GUJ93_ZPchr0003g17393 [Zizania palustris]